MEGKLFMGQPLSGRLLEWVQITSPGTVTNNVYRFVVLPVIPIVFGETLRRRSVGWAVGLTLLLVVEEILVPETISSGAPVLVCVVAAELVHRRPGQNLWTSLRLTRWCVGTGLAGHGRMGRVPGGLRCAAGVHRLLPRARARAQLGGRLATEAQV